MRTFNLVCSLFLVAFGIAVCTPLSLTFAFVALATGVADYINPMED